MKKKILALMLGLTLALSLAACGSSSDSSASDDAATAEVQESEAPAADDTAEADAAEEEETVTSDDFTLLDVESSMIEAGVYCTNDSGIEYVISLFTIPSGETMCSIFAFDPDGTGDVFCGEMTADNTATETDDDGITWTVISPTDVYSGNEFTATFAEAGDEVYMADLEGNVYTGTYLSADDTITYMGVAAALLEEQ